MSDLFVALTQKVEKQSREICGFIDISSKNMLEDYVSVGKITIENRIILLPGVRGGLCNPSWDGGI